MRGKGALDDLGAAFAPGETYIPTAARLIGEASGLTPVAERLAAAQADPDSVYHLVADESPRAMDPEAIREFFARIPMASTRFKRRRWHQCRPISSRISPILIAIIALILGMMIGFSIASISARAVSQTALSSSALSKPFERSWPNNCSISNSDAAAPTSETVATCAPTSICAFNCSSVNIGGPLTGKPTTLTAGKFAGKAGAA